MNKSILLSFFLVCFCLCMKAQDGLNVFINIAGEVVSEDNYSYPKIDGIILFCENGSYGIKNEDGKVLVYDAKYKMGLYLGHGVTVLSTEWKDFLFDRNGKPLPCGDIDLIGNPGWVLEVSDRKNYPYMVHYFWGKLLVKKGDKYGMIDTLGNWVVNPEYELLSDMLDPVYYIKKNGKNGLLIKATKQEILTEYDNIEYFSDGLAAVEKKGKWGYIDYNGKLVIPLKKATAAGYFIEGAAFLQNKDKIKWINKTGEEINVTDRNPDKERDMKIQFDILINHVYGGSSKSTNNFLYSRLEGRYLDKGMPFLNLSRIEWIYLSNFYLKDPKGYPFGALINRYGKLVPVDTAGMYQRNAATTISLLPVTIGKDSCVFVDTTGKVAIPEIFTKAEYFDGRGLAKVVQSKNRENLKIAKDQEYRDYVKQLEIKRAAEAKALEEKEKVKAAQKEAGKPCDKCGGSGYLGANKKTCSVCMGDGGKRCTVCGGAGRIYSADRTNSQNCSSCSGTGKKSCYSCDGKGYTVDSNATICPSCNGSGHK